MTKTLTKLATGAILLAGLTAPAFAADVSLARIPDCGTPQAPIEVNQRFSDTYAFPGLKLQFVFSCYIIKHGDEYMMWDTGHSMTAPNVAPKVSIVDQLAKIDVKPEQIKYVGISHYHADHTGQVASFPKATLLIGTREWDSISAPKPAEGVNFKPFESWIKGDSKVEPLPIGLDKDVFGDGSVIILRTPGHTPGHSSLLVKLAADGSGDPPRRCRALPRELRFGRRSGLQLRPRPDRRLDGAHEEDARQSEGHDDHPARCARRRQTSGISGVREVSAWK